MFNYQELEQKLVNTYNELHNIKETAKRFNMNYSIVSFFLHCAGIKIERPKITTRPRINIPLEELKHLYVDEGWEIVDLEVEFNCSTNTILDRLREAGVKLRGKKLKTERFTPEIIKKLYWEDKMSSKEIGQKYNVSGQLILVYMRKNDIPTRKTKKR